MKVENGKWEMEVGNGSAKWEWKMRSVIGRKKRMAPTSDAILFVLS